MFKVQMNRFFAVIAVLFCIGANVLAEVKFSGAGSERVVVDSETLNLKLDFSATKQYYLDKSHWASESYGVKPDEQKMFKLTVGGCQVEMWAEWCSAVKAHIRVGKDKPATNHLDDETGKKDIMRSFNAVVSKDAITVEVPTGRNPRSWKGGFPCNVQFDKISAPGRYVVDVSLSGPNIAPQLVTTIDGERFTTTTSTTTTQASTTTSITTTQAPTTTSTTTTQAPATTSTTTTQAPTTTTQALTTTTQAPSTTLVSTTTSKPPTTTIQAPTSMPTTTPVPTTTSSDVTSTTVMSLSSPQYEDHGLAPWLIGLIVAAIVLALLTIVLCVVIFCCYRRKQKSKAQAVTKSEHSTVKRTINTASKPLVKETNQYGPDMMYFARDATPVDPNAKSQAANPASASSSMMKPPQ